MAFFDDDWFDFILPENVSGEHEALLISILCLTLILLSPVVLFYLIGSQQRIATGATRRRLLFGSLVATGLTLAPAITSAIIFWLTRNSNELLPSSGLFLSILTWGAISAYFRPPHYLRNSGEPLVVVTDQALLSRIRELADRMRIACPAVRLLRSISGDQQTIGYLSGWPCATVIVSDGLLNRITETERDALICHELAHVANKTLPIQMALISLAATIGVVALSCGVVTWLLVFPSLLIGLNRLVMRRLELDCDRRAACATSFLDTATALQKIHRLGLDGQTSSWLRKLIHATAVHPPLAARLRSLSSRALEPDRSRMPEPGADESVLAFCSVAAWAICFSVGCWLGTSPAWWANGISAVLLIGVSVTPRLLLRAASPKGVDRARLQRWVQLALVTLVGGFVVVALRLTPSGGHWDLPFGDQSPWLFPTFGSLYCLAMLGLLIVSTQISAQESSRQKLEAAWRKHDFAAIRRLSRNLSPRDDYGRSMAGIARALLGDRPGAITEFEQLVLDHPQASQHYTVLASLLIEDNLLDRALAVSETIKERFPTSGLSEAISSRALRRMGRLDESYRQIEKAMELLADNGAIWAAAAGVETDRGDFASARRLLQLANEKSPGTVQELVEDARLACQTESDDTAIPKLQRAIVALQENPLMLRLTDLATLQVKLAERLSADRTSSATETPA